MLLTRACKAFKIVKDWNNQLDGNEALPCPSPYLAKASVCLKLSAKIPYDVLTKCDIFLFRSTLHFIAPGDKPRLWRWREATSGIILL
eukprot:572108-Ditylum_brightwellii.AAC.1